MARMPGVRWSPVSDGNSKLPMKRWDVACIHTIVGHDPAGAAHFSTGSDGLITQSRDTAVQSAANYQGNPRVIAIENEDFGPEYGSWSSPHVPRFTAAQAESIAKVLAWCHQVHGIPLVLCPNSKSTSRGVGYHRQGIDGNWAGFAYGGRVSGGEVWTTTPGKVCPGDQRIAQLINEIIPRARVLAGLQQEKQEDDVSFQEVLPSAWNPSYSVTASVWLTTTAAKVETLQADNAQMRATLAEILAAVTDGGVSPQDVLARLEAGATAGAEKAVAQTVLPALAALQSALDADNAAEARAVVDELSARLARAA